MSKSEAWFAACLVAGAISFSIGRYLIYYIIAYYWFNGNL